jgi:hypothetical protein
MKIPKASRLVGLALAVALPACATKTKAPVGGTDYLRTYVGQQRVLRFQGDQEKVAVKMKDRPQLTGACDTAVEIKSAVADKAGVRLSLETLGAASAEKAHPRCGRIPPAVTLTLAGFGGNSGAVGGRIEQILPTPEGYLRAYGIAFDRPAGAEPALAASSVDLRTATDEERRLEVRLTAPPRRLFWVDPIYRDARHAVQYQGEVEVDGVVGVDGRLYRPQVRGSLEKPHVAAIKRVMPLWRFEPALTGKVATPAHVLSRVVFRIE